MLIREKTGGRRRGGTVCIEEGILLPLRATLLCPLRLPPLLGNENASLPFPPSLGCLIRENMQCRGNFPVSLCPDLTFVFLSRSKFKSRHTVVGASEKIAL